MGNIGNKQSETTALENKNTNNNNNDNNNSNNNNQIIYSNGNENPNVNANMSEKKILITETKCDFPLRRLYQKQRKEIKDMTLQFLEKCLSEKKCIEKNPIALKEKLIKCGVSPSNFFQKNMQLLDRFYSLKQDMVTVITDFLDMCFLPEFQIDDCINLWEFHCIQSNYSKKQIDFFEKDVIVCLEPYYKKCISIQMQILSLWFTLESIQKVLEMVSIYNDLNSKAREYSVRSPKDLKCIQSFRFVKMTFNNEFEFSSFLNSKGLTPWNVKNPFTTNNDTLRGNEKIFDSSHVYYYHPNCKDTIYLNFIPSWDSCQKLLNV